jgi:hypothetical protein
MMGSGGGWVMGWIANYRRWIVALGWVGLAPMGRCCGDGVLAILFIS